VTTPPVSAIPPRILPALDDVNRPFWTGGATGELRIAHCGSCLRYVHPPRAACLDCGDALEFVAVSGEATLFTYTVAFQQFHPDVPTPFVIAVVELAEQSGLRLVSNVVECDREALVSGMPLRVRFERHDNDTEPVFVPVFAPVDALT
jgi:uncharacterized OB-fold protein